MREMAETKREVSDVWQQLTDEQREALFKWLADTMEDLGEWLGKAVKGLLEVLVKLAEEVTE